MKKFSFFMLLALMLGASTTRIWKRGGVEALLKGSLRGVSLSWNGIIAPSFKLTPLPNIKEDYLLCILKDGDSFWIGTGHDGKLYRIDSSGKVHLVYDAPELDIYAIAKDQRGNIYFATSPRGKIYRVTGEKVEEFFDPEEGFIWKLIYRDGALYAATGKPSALYKIDLQGAGKKLFEVPDSQILDFSFDGEKIYLATSGKGRVYQYDGKAVHLLWESPYEEVSSLAVWKGKIYAATQGKIKKSKIPSLTSTSMVVTVTPKSSAKSSFSFPVKGKSVVYQIDPVSRKAMVFWENPHKYVSSLRIYRGRLYASTGGDKARVFQLVDFYKANLLEEVEAKEIRTLYAADRLYFLTSAPTGIYRMEATRSGGYYLSDVLDAGGQANWGRIYFKGEGVEVYTRSGNSSKPDSTWEGWSPPVFSGEKVLSSPARYLQVKIKIPPASRFTSFRVYYRKMNLSPRILKIEVYPPGVVFKEYSKEKIRGLPDSIQEEKSSAITGKKMSKKGFRTVMWKATDPDGDRLLYKISIKGNKLNLTLEKQWKDNYYAFDTTFLPDGEYKVVIEASDLLSNPPQEALRVSKASTSFLVDNTPSEITLRPAGGGIEVVVRDSGSGVKGLLYTLDGKNWLIARPDDGICDSQEEKFTFKNKKPIALRAVDLHGNSKTLPLGGK